MIEYRESLEERGIRSPEEIKRKVATHRKRLEAEYGLSNSNEDASGRSMYLKMFMMPLLFVFVAYAPFQPFCFLVYLQREHLWRGGANERTAMKYQERGTAAGAEVTAPNGDQPTETGRGNMIWKGTGKDAGIVGTETEVLILKRK